MSDTDVSTGSGGGAARYEIRLAGRIEQRWAAWFDGLTLSHLSDGTTVLSGPVVDQSALHGLLQKVRDLGLQLVSVAQVEPDSTDLPIPASMTHQTTTGSTP
jgi:hypothetical protein